MKKLILLIGCPGSGKTTRARAILNDCLSQNLTCTIRSTDDQFLIRGVYKFNPRLLHNNHENNQELVRSDMEDNVNVIIVDNTNILKRHRAPYKALALQHDYEIEEIIVGEFNEEAVKKYAHRNLHGVPLESIKRMAKEFLKENVS